MVYWPTCVLHQSRAQRPYVQSFLTAPKMGPLGKIRARIYHRGCHLNTDVWESIFDISLTQDVCARSDRDHCFLNLVWFRSDNFQKWILAYMNNNLALFGMKICSIIVHSERGSRFLPQTLSIREAKFFDCVARRELWAFKEHNVQRQMSYLAYFCAKFRLWCVPYPSNNTLIEKIT